MTWAGLAYVVGAPVAVAVVLKVALRRAAGRH